MAPKLPAPHGLTPSHDGEDMYADFMMLVTYIIAMILTILLIIMMVMTLILELAHDLQWWLPCVDAIRLDTSS